MSNTQPQQTYNQYLIRKICSNKFGGGWGITIPRHIKDQIGDNVKWSIELSEDCKTIILKSGLDIAQLRRTISQYNIEQL